MSDYYPSELESSDFGSGSSEGHRIGLRPAQADVMVKREGAAPFVEPERRLERLFLPTDFGEEPKRGGQLMSLKLTSLACMLAGGLLCSAQVCHRLL